jgi:Type IV secretion-system coupling protein DNA-binding domain
MIALIAILVLGGSSCIGVLLGARWLDSRSWRRSLVALTVRVPRDTGVEQVSRWLARIQVLTESPKWSLLHDPVAVELVANSRDISVFVLAPERLHGSLLASIQAALPGARVDTAADYLAVRPPMRVAAEATITNLRRPLATERAAETSQHLLSSLLPLSQSEQIVVQWILSGVRRPRPRHMRQRTAAAGAVLPWWLDSDAVTDAEEIRAERIKYQYPLLAASLRVGVAAPTTASALSVFRRLWPVFSGLDAPGVRIVRRWLPMGYVGWQLRALWVPLMRFPLLLNVAELAGLTGLGRQGSTTPGLPGGIARTLPAPPDVPARGLIFADTNFHGQARPLALMRTDRLRHTWCLGPTGSGKSTLLQNLIEQDMQAGDGLILFDARGDLVYELLDRVPLERRDDVVLMDPTNTQAVVGFNPLGLGRTERERELAAEHVLSVLHSVYHANWGPRTADVLRASLLTLTHSTAVDDSRMTLTELPELLVNDRFRAFALRQHLPDGVRLFWQWYENLSLAERNSIIAPVLNKLRQFVLSTPLRLMLGQSDGLDLGDLFAKRRIILVPLKKGLLGGESMALIGSLLMAAVWHATLAQAAVPPERRQPTWLYADEFQEILRLPIDLADMLAMARGYGLGMTLAHQYLDQLPPDVKAAVLGTVKSQLIFQVDYNDARTLAPRFAPLTAEDLQSLGTHEVAFKPAVRGHTLAPITGITRPPSTPNGGRADVTNRSLTQFARSAAEIEASLVRRRQGSPSERSNKRAKGGGS